MSSECEPMPLFDFIFQHLGYYLVLFHNALSPAKPQSNQRSSAKITVFDAQQSLDKNILEIVGFNFNIKHSSATSTRIYNFHMPRARQIGGNQVHDPLF